MAEYRSTSFGKFGVHAWRDGTTPIVFHDDTSRFSGAKGPADNTVGVVGKILDIKRHWDALAAEFQRDGDDYCAPIFLRICSRQELARNVALLHCRNLPGIGGRPDFIIHRERKGCSDVVDFLIGAPSQPKLSPRAIISKVQ